MHVFDHSQPENYDDDNHHTQGDHGYQPRHNEHQHVEQLHPLREHHDLGGEHTTPWHDLPNQHHVDPGHFDPFHHPQGFGVENAQHHPQHQPWPDSLSHHLQHYQHFNPSSTGHMIIGNPEIDMQYWHEQSHPYCCGVVTQGFVLASLTGHDVPENILEQKSVADGSLIPGLGMPLQDVGKIIETSGFQIQQLEHGSLFNLEHELANNNKVIVGVNSKDIWFSHETGAQQPLDAFPGIPGQNADHVVEVIGLDYNQAGQPLVILNDPGLPDGGGIEVPLEVFMHAWDASNNFMVATTGQPYSTPVVGFSLDYVFENEIVRRNW